MRHRLPFFILCIVVMLWCMAIQYQLIEVRGYIVEQTRFDHAVTAALFGDKN